MSEDFQKDKSGRVCNHSISACQAVITLSIGNLRPTRKESE
jgi:hypothetical protein